MWFVLLCRSTQAIFSISFSTSIWLAVPRFFVSSSPLTKPINPKSPLISKLSGVTLSRWKVLWHFSTNLLSIVGVGKSITFLPSNTSLPLL